MIQILKNRWEKFWFSPLAPQYLGICRFLFFGWLFCWYISMDFTGIAIHPPDFWAPVKLLQLTGLESQPSIELLAPLQIVWKLSLLAACLGFFARSSCLVALLVGTYLLALTHSFNKINHSDAGLMFAIGILALSRSGDSLSIDALRARRKQRTEIKPHGEYRWPIQMIRVVLVTIFFAAGYSKLHTGGIKWMTEGFGTILVQGQYSHHPLLPIGFWIASHTYLAMILAAGSVVVELAAPIALFSRVAQAVLIPSLFLMQVGIKLLMSDDFTQFMALYLFWVPWPYLLNYFSRTASLNRISRPDAEQIQLRHATIL